MKLNSDDRNLLALLTFRGDRSMRELADELGIREHKARYIFDKLVKSGCCYFYPFVNPHRLGFMEFELFFSLKSGGEVGRKRLLEALKQSPRIKYVGALGGEYQVDAMLMARNLNDLKSTIDQISRSCPELEYQIDMLLLGSSTYFSANFLEPEKLSDATIVFAPSESIYHADEIDKKILEGLFNQRYSSMSKLAKEIKISESTLNYRLERLHGEKVLLGLGYIVDHLQVGLTLTTLLVKAKKPSAKLTSELTDFLKSLRSVSFIVESYGAWDYQIGVVLYDQTKISSIVDRIGETFSGQIGRILPIPAFETVKWEIRL